MLQQLHLPANLIICKHEKISSKFFFNLFNKANFETKKETWLMFGIDFCDVKNEIQVLSQVFLKTPILNAVAAEVTELNYRKKSKKDVVYFQPEENHKIRVAKGVKV